MGLVKGEAVSSSNAAVSVVALMIQKKRVIQLNLCSTDTKGRLAYLERLQPPGLFGPFLCKGL